MVFLGWGHFVHCVPDFSAADAGFLEPAEGHGIDAHVAGPVYHDGANVQSVRDGKGYIDRLGKTPARPYSELFAS